MSSLAPTGAGNSRPRRERKQTTKAAEAAQQQAVEHADHISEDEGAPEPKPKREPAPESESVSSDNGASTSSGTKRARIASQKAREAKESEQADKKVSAAKFRAAKTPKSIEVKFGSPPSPAKRVCEAVLTDDAPPSKVRRNSTMKEVYSFVEGLISHASKTGDFLKYNQPRLKEAQAAEGLMALQDAKLMKLCDGYAREEAVAAW